ncbi:hypothetical protein KCP71_16680 [Salmonella enterica subsp. enterica]|nr:hypothetical protein KCP71_16680 [Salmonella enterica subsp. enterica]
MLPTPAADLCCGRGFILCKSVIVSPAQTRRVPSLKLHLAHNGNAYICWPCRIPITPTAVCLQPPHPPSRLAQRGRGRSAASTARRDRRSASVNASGRRI